MLNYTMHREKLRNSDDWTKIDVKKETRDRLQIYRRVIKSNNVDEVIRKLLNAAEKLSK
jgi:hypothetical protein